MSTSTIWVFLILPAMLLLAMFCGLLFVIGILLLDRRRLNTQGAAHANAAAESLNDAIANYERRLEVVHSDYSYQIAELENNIDRQVEAARADSLKRSRNTMRGQATEHLAPLLMEGMNPKDCRFIGDPIDYIVFRGLGDLRDGASDDELSIHLLDIKSGKANLSKVQRRIRNAIMNGNISFSIFNPDSNEFKEYHINDHTSGDRIPVQYVQETDEEN